MTDCPTNSKRIGTRKELRSIKAVATEILQQKKDHAAPSAKTTPLHHREPSFRKKSPKQHLHFSSMNNFEDSNENNKTLSHNPRAFDIAEISFEVDKPQAEKPLLLQKCSSVRKLKAPPRDSVLRSLSTKSLESTKSCTERTGRTTSIRSLSSTDEESNHESNNDADRKRSDNTAMLSKTSSWRARDNARQNSRRSLHQQHSRTLARDQSLSFSSRSLTMNDLEIDPNGFSSIPRRKKGQDSFHSEKSDGVCGNRGQTTTTLQEMMNRSWGNSSHQSESLLKNNSSYGSGGIGIDKHSVGNISDESETSSSEQEERDGDRSSAPGVLRGFHASCASDEWSVGAGLVSEDSESSIQ